MTTANIKLVQAVYAAFQQRDLAALIELVSPQIEIRQTEQLPWGGHYEGLSGLQAFFAKLTANIDSDLSFDNLLDAGDEVVAIGRTSGTVVKNGAPFDVQVVHLWSIEQGLVKSFRPFIDTPLMLASIAAL